MHEAGEARLDRGQRRARAAASSTSRATDVVAGHRRELGDAVAHDPGADDGDLHAGTLALAVGAQAELDLADQRAVQVVAALDDLQHLRVAVHPPDAVVRRDAVGAVDLHGVGGAAQRDVARVHLRHARQLAGPLAALERLARSRRTSSRAVCGTDRHVGDLRLHDLELRDRLAERVALARVGDRVVEARLGDADRTRGDAEATALDGGHRDLEAVALLAEQRVGPDADLVEDDLAGAERPEAELVLVRDAARARACRAGR